MATYTVTGAANLLTQNPAFVTRVAVAMLKYAATKYDPTKGSPEQTFIRTLAANPNGTANAALYPVVSLLNVAAPGTDVAPLLPTDSELSATVAALWAFLTGS